MPSTNDYDRAFQRFREVDIELLAAKEAFLSSLALDPKKRSAAHERLRDVRREWTRATTDLFEAGPPADGQAPSGVLFAAHRVG